MFRRVITVFVLILLASLWLAACGGEEEETPPPTPTEVPTTAPEPTVEPTAVPEEPAAEEAEEAEAEETDAEEAEGEEADAEEAEGEEAEAEEAETEEAEGAEAEAEEADAEVAEGEEAEAEEPAAGLVSIESGRNVNDVVNEKSAAFSAISPNGEMIVYAVSEGRFFKTTGSLCVFTFANADKRCYEAPEEYKGYPYTLVWSPDSTKVAFTENPIQLGYESDVWIFDVNDGTYTNRTDDGVTGSYVASEAGSYTLDYLPMWNQADGDLYFWRSMPTGEFAVFTMEFMRLPAEGDAELVRDLSEELAGGLMWFDNEHFFMDGPSAMSDDGNQVAIWVTALQDVYESPRTGLWLLDLTDESSELQKLAGVEDFQIAQPQWMEVPAMPQGLQWTADGNVVVFTLANDLSLPLVLLYYSDVDSGELIPVVDFSDSTERDAFFTEQGPNGLPARFYSPWTATLSPRGTTLLLISDLSGVAGVLAAPLPPDGSLPYDSGHTETISSALVTRSSRADEALVVAYGTLLTVIEE